MYYTGKTSFTGCTWCISCNDRCVVHWVRRVHRVLRGGGVRCTVHVMHLGHPAPADLMHPRHLLHLVHPN